MRQPVPNDPATNELRPTHGAAPDPLTGVDVPPPSRVDGASTSVALGQVVVGIGLGLCASSLFQLGTRLGLGTELDDRVFGGVATVLALVGAILFGPLGRAREKTGWALATVAASVGSILTLAVIGAITSPLGFKEHCLRFGSDASLAGTPFVDAVSALVMFIVPAFGVGAVLGARRRWVDRLVITAGLTVGWLIRPSVFSAMESMDWKNAGSAGVVFYGAIVAALGLVLAARSIGSGATNSGAVRWTCIGLVLAAGLSAVPITSIIVHHPWQRFPVKPLEVFETASGQFTVQPTGAASLQLFIDQRPVTPGADDLSLEAACLQRTAEAWQHSNDVWPPKRTLVVGWITPERADLLAAFGLAEFQHTANFHADAARIQAALWREGSPPGEPIAPEDVSGQPPYDLVFAFPTGAYRAAGWGLDVVASAPATFKAAWLPGDMGPQATWAGARLVFASRGIERFAFGLLESPMEDPMNDAVESFETHPALPQPITFEWINTRPEARPLAALRRAAAGVDAALAAHADVQRISSPFESPLEQVEISPAALAAWGDRATAEGARPSSFLRGTVEGAAAVLMAQGEVLRLRQLVDPVATRFPDWVGLQIALAWAEAQELQFQAAAARLRPLVAADPDRRDLQMALAEALVELGDPEGRGIAQGLLRDDPENPRLFGLARGVRGMTSIGQPGGYESLNPEEALTLADGAVLGTITGISVQEVDPKDGAPLFLTTLTVSGTKLASRTLPGPASFEPEADHQVTFLGGFTDPEHGTFNSTAPPAHRTRIGRRIFYYYQSQDDIAGGVAGHALLRGSAGLFTAFEFTDPADVSAAPKVIVQGRGNTAAIPYNLVRDELIAPH